MDLLTSLSWLQQQLLVSSSPIQLRNVVDMNLEGIVKLANNILVFDYPHTGGPIQTTSVP